MISRIYTRHARINIHDLEPLYALSTPGAITALGLIFYPYLLAAFAPLPRGEAWQLILVPIFGAIAAATFALPLWGAHRRLVAEKKRRLSEASSLFDATTAQIHRRLNSRQLRQMDFLHKALASLEIEQNTLRKIPTWPWEPGALRAILAAVLLPLAVWLLQLLIGRFLGG